MLYSKDKVHKFYMNGITVEDLRPYTRKIWSVGDNIVFDNPVVIATPQSGAAGIGDCKKITKNTVINEDNIRVELNEFRFINERIMHSTIPHVHSLQMREKLNTTIVIYDKILSLMKRRRVIRRLRMYLTTHMLVIDWFKETMEKSYAPDGPGYTRVYQGYE